MKTIFTSFLKFIVAIVLIAWMIYSGMLDLSSLAVLTNPLYFIASFFLVFLTVVINNLRWTLLLKMQDFKFSTKQTFPLTLIGVFFNYAIPGGVGGDVVKGYYLFKHSPTKKTLGTTTLFLDRLMGMFGMVLVSAVMIIVNYSTIIGRSSLQALALSVLVVFFLITLFFILSFSSSFKNLRIIDFIYKRIPGGSLIQNIYSSIHSYRKNPRVLLKTLILSLFSQFMIIVFIWFFARITGAPNVSFTVYLFIVPIGLITTAIPITPAGIGVGQAAMYYLYQLYTGFDNQIGPNALTAYQVVLFCWGLLGAYFYISKRDLNPSTHISKFE